MIAVHCDRRLNTCRSLVRVAHWRLLKILCVYLSWESFMAPFLMCNRRARTQKCWYQCEGLPRLLGQAPVQTLYYSSKINESNAHKAFNYYSTSRARIQCIQGIPPMPKRPSKKSSSTHSWIHVWSWSSTFNMICCSCVGTSTKGGQRIRQ